MDRTRHLDELRGASAYPVYRALVSLVTSVTLLVAFVVAAGGVWMMSALGQVAGGWISVGVGVLLGLWAFVLREVLLMVADRTDATLELAARAAGQK